MTVMDLAARRAPCHGAELGVPLTPTASVQGRLRGAVLPRFPDPGTAAAVAGRTPGFGRIGAGRNCAGVEYLGLFWRTHPWDHAPGVLLVEEAGSLRAPARRGPQPHEVGGEPRPPQPRLTSELPLLVAAGDARPVLAPPHEAQA
ncbi:MAG: hypothetical protein ACRD1K_16840 [Acidimicrobiales bacterium]